MENGRRHRVPSRDRAGSKKQPFCDGSHKGTSFTPMRFTAENDGVQNLCGCKATEDKPFCDGGHNML